MGPMVKTTKHLVLRVENENKANEVLALYDRNRASFERFEPTRPAGFYTIDYHAAMLRREYKAYIKLKIRRGAMVRSSNKKLLARKGAPSYNSRESNRDKNREMFKPWKNTEMEAFRSAVIFEMAV